MSDPTEIYLQPECCADEGVGRIWCDHDAPVDCDEGVPWTKYVLASEYDEALKRIEDLEWENKGIAEWREFGMKCLAAAKEQRERADALRVLLQDIDREVSIPAPLCDRIDDLLWRAPKEKP